MHPVPGGRGKIRKEITYSYIGALLIFFLDQSSKYFIEKCFGTGDSFAVIKRFFHITLVHNTGAAFGILKGFPHFFAIIAFIAIPVTIYFLTRYGHITAAERTALTFLLGGILGNLADRLRFGYVIDFLDFRVWPVFNAADSFITVGIALLAWGMVKSKK